MNIYQTSKGHNFSTSKWLNLHFDALLPEYSEMIDYVGIKRGSYVLDAGCGNGRFIDLIDKKVGSEGNICAIDLAPENIKIIKKKIVSSSFSSHVIADVGDVTALPFLDNTFDVVWCAAVTQYLTEEELEKALDEFKRVVKKGGIIAIKEIDGISAFYYPTAELTLLWRGIDMMDAFDKQKWLIHPLEMPVFFKKAGLKNVMQKTIIAERRNPLRSVEKLYIEGLIQTGQVSWSDIASLPKIDQKEWRSLLSKSSKEYILKRPNFYWREGHILVKGYV